MTNVSMRKMTAMKLEASGKDAGDVEELKKGIQLETHATGKPEKFDHEHNLPNDGQPERPAAAK